jgi:redox-sensitive bicupin YhaK (pirin superfamily)
MVGHHAGHRSPLVPPTEVTLLDATLSVDGHLEHPLPRTENVAVYVLGGAVEADGRRLVAGEVAAFAGDGDQLLLRGLTDATRVAVFAGPPLREPLVAQGPFVMNNRAQIEQAFADYQAGRMGRLAPAS